MEDILLSKLLKDVKDPRIRQTLESDLPERAVFGSGGVSGFLGTTELPPEAYGTEYKNLPDPFRKAVEEVAEMDLKKLRTQAGQNQLGKALSKQGVPPKEITSFVKTAREAAEVWLGKDSKEFMKTVAKAEAPSKVGHIADLLKTNNKGVPKVNTLWRFIKGGLKTAGKAKALGAAGLVGAGIVKLLEQGVEDQRPAERTFKVVEPDAPVAREEKKVDSLDDLKKLREELNL